MPDLAFQIEGAQAVPFAVAPMLAFRLRVTNSLPDPIHTVALRAQIQIEASRRSYSAKDQEKLKDLFGGPERWGQTVRTMLWTHASTIVPAFTYSNQVDLEVPCTFDFNVAATKYFQGLESGEIPLCFQFSGTVFYEGPGRHMQVSPVSWDKEARFRLPVEVWKAMMELYYPNSAWLCLKRDVFERLHDYKIQNEIPTWEQLLEGLLQGASAEVSR